MTAINYLNRISALHFLLLLLIAFIAYSPVISSYFLADDFTLIGRTANEGVFFTWGEDTGGYLRPVTLASYWADYQLWGFNPAGYHVTNIILHAVAGIALFLFSARLYREWLTDTGFILPAFLTATLFLVLPSHSESVSWIAGRTDLIAAAVSLTATYFFIRHVTDRGISSALISILLLAAAVYAKESAIIIPAVWVLLYLMLKSSSRTPSPTRQSGWLIASGFIIILYLLSRRLIFGSFAGESGTGFSSNFPFAEIPGNLVRYILRVLLPAFPLRVIVFLSSPVGIILIFVFISALLLILIRAFRNADSGTLRLSAVAAAAFLISLLPVIGFKVSIVEVLSERFLYIPSAFACIGLVSLLNGIFRSRRLFISVLSGLILLEFIALRWINDRWITAGDLSKNIASEVSAYDPDSVVILNLPDHFRGAYVLRSGLSNAATVFQGNERRGEYKVLSTHSLLSVEDEIHVSADASRIELILPEPLEFCSISETMYHSRQNCDTLIVIPPRHVKILFFSNGRMHSLQN